MAISALLSDPENTFISIPSTRTMTSSDHSNDPPISLDLLLLLASRSHDRREHFEVDIAQCNPIGKIVAGMTV
jgi:hypothetical protein